MNALSNSAVAMSSPLSGSRREPTNEERLQAREAAGKIYKMASLLCDVAGGERKITEAEAAMIKAICDVKP